MAMTTQVTGSTLSAVGDEDHVLLAAIGPAVEPAVQRLDLEAGLVEQLQPLGRGKPVEREGDRRTVRADREGECSRLLVPVGSLEDPGLPLEPATVRLLDVLAARREDVEDEVPAGLQELARCAERETLLVLGGHVEERPERTDDQRDAFGHWRIAKVADPKIEPFGDSCILGG